MNVGDLVGAVTSSFVPNAVKGQVRAKSFPAQPGLPIVGLVIGKIISPKKHKV